MSEPFQPNLDFDAAQNAADDGEALIIDIDGFEGPMHVLLALARQQKVDLLKLSVTKLVDQYLAFVREARRRRFSLAADYLVMAAWLAYLKSRLMLPKPQKDSEEAGAEEMASHLAFRLAKLDAMRRAAEWLKGGPQLKRDVFVRGDPEAVKILSSTRLEGDLYALMAAYVGQKTKAAAGRRYTPRPAEAYPLDEARERLAGLLAEMQRWTPLSGVTPMPAAPGSGPSRASYLASTLSACLELVKEGSLEARQLEHFADIYLRARAQMAAQ